MISSSKFCYLEDLVAKTVFDLVNINVLQPKNTSAKSRKSRGISTTSHPVTFQASKHRQVVRCTPRSFELRNLATCSARGVFALISKYLITTASSNGTKCTFTSLSGVPSENGKQGGRNLFLKFRSFKISKFSRPSHLVSNGNRRLF